MTKLITIAAIIAFILFAGCGPENSNSEVQSLSASSDIEKEVVFEDTFEQLEYCSRDDINPIVSRAQPGGPYPYYEDRCSDVSPHIYPACSNYDKYCRVLVK